MRALSEAECYARCYGRSGDESVRIVRIEPRPRRVVVASLSGDDVRRLFEERLEAREAEAA